VYSLTMPVIKALIFDVVIVTEVDCKCNIRYV